MLRFGSAVVLKSKPVDLAIIEQVMFHCLENINRSVGRNIIKFVL